MGMRRKPAAGVHKVFIDHAQIAEAHERCVVVISKRKGVIGIQPAKIEVTSVFCLAYYDHDDVSK
jgi:hypothetical protein